jgi:hypothetical protein
MSGQMWLGVEPPEDGGVVDELDPLELDPLELDPLEVEALVVWAVVDAGVVVVAVAADTPRPRLSPRALAAIPAATNGRLSFIRESS